MENIYPQGRYLSIEENIYPIWKIYSFIGKKFDQERK
jgi:hypothetical protein